IDPDSERTLYRKSLTVAEAFREHVRTWFGDAPDGLKRHIVRYEDLIENPDEAFQQIFDFLELECPLARAFLDVKVSLYSQHRQQRGIINAWRHSEDRYQTLLQDVH